MQPAAEHLFPCKGTKSAGRQCGCSTGSRSWLSSGWEGAEPWSPPSLQRSLLCMKEAL